MISKSSIVCWIISLFFFLGGPATAADCQADVKSCTPKQLCEAATSISEGKKVWSSVPTSAGHVKTAKSIGINCGVVEVVSSCETNPEMCTLTEICEKAVYSGGFLKMWNKDPSASEYVAIAKEYGLACGTTPAESHAQTTSESTQYPVPKETRQCKNDKTTCSDNELCYRIHVYNEDNVKNWRVKSYKQEAKVRGLNCENRNYKYETASSIDKNGLSFNDFPPQPRISQVPNSTLEALYRGEIGRNRYLKSYAERKNYWGKALKAGAGFNGKYFLTRDGCGSSCKLYQLLDLTNSQTFSFPYGGEEHWDHELIFDANSSLMKIVYPINDYDKDIYNCAIEEFSWSERRKSFGYDQKFVFPVEQGTRCYETNDWKHVHRQFKKWKANPAKATLDTQKLNKAEAVTQLQRELNRLGCKAGVPDGVKGPNTLAAIQRFRQSVDASNVTELPVHEFIKALKRFPNNTCKAEQTERKNVNTNTSLNPGNSAEMEALRLERQQIEANLRSMEELFARQKRAAQAPYKACLSNCLLNNKAGKGFSNAVSGLAECNSSCAPLKYGGVAVPPSWERYNRRLETIDCKVTQMSKNQATARCNQF